METEFFFWDEDAIRKNEIETIIRDHWILIDKYFINLDASIDVEGDVKFSENMGFLKELPLRFNRVSGDFDCSRLSLQSLKGSPVEVGGRFNCLYNQLSTLEYLPKRASCFIFDNTVKSFYTGGVNCNFEKVVLLPITDIPVYLNPKLKLDNFQLRLFFKYQSYFGIYEEKIFNEEAFEEFIQEVNGGLQ